jgi:hypothetical protein
VATPFAFPEDIDAPRHKKENELIRDRLYGDEDMECGKTSGDGSADLARRCPGRLGAQTSLADDHCLATDPGLSQLASGDIQ